MRMEDGWGDGVRKKELAEHRDALLTANYLGRATNRALGSLRLASGCCPVAYSVQTTSVQALESPPFSLFFLSKTLSSLSRTDYDTSQGSPHRLRYSVLVRKLPACSSRPAGPLSDPSAIEAWNWPSRGRSCQTGSGESAGHTGCIGCMQMPANRSNRQGSPELCGMAPVTPEVRDRIQACVVLPPLVLCAATSRTRTENVCVGYGTKTEHADRNLFDIPRPDPYGSVRRLPRYQGDTEYRSDDR